MRLIVAVFACAGVASCAPVTYPGGIGLVRVADEVRSEPLSETNFTLGEARTAIVGETFVRVKDFRRVETSSPFYRPDRPGTLVIGSGRFPLSVTMNTPAFRDVDGRRYAMAGTNALALDNEGRFTGRFLVMNGPGVYADDGSTGTIEPVDLRFVPHGEVRSTQQASGENYEIVFTGRDASSMRFQYREYTSDDLGRPAFTQDLTYPLTASSIRYRTLTLAIDNVGPDSITYRVLERR